MYAEKPVPGLYNWGCPNPLGTDEHPKGEAHRAAAYGRNVLEAIVDKDNHARDAMKYHLMMHPEPSVKPLDRRIAERLEEAAKIDPTLAAMKVRQIIAEEQDEEEDLEPRYMGMNYRRRLQDEARRRRLREGRKW